VKLRLRPSCRYDERGAQKSTLRMRFLRRQRLNAARTPYEPRESADGVSRRARTRCDRMAGVVAT
jgi:hypothetical protein